MRGDRALLYRRPVLCSSLATHPIIAHNAFCSRLTGAPCCAAKCKKKNSRWMHLGAAEVERWQKIQCCWAHCTVSNPSFSTSVICASVPCALCTPLLADCCVHPPPSCLFLPPPQARPFIPICPGHRHLSPSRWVATSCRAIAVPSKNSKLPLVCPKWFSCGLSSRHHFLMHRHLSMCRLVVVLTIAAPTPPLTVVLPCCYLSVCLQFAS